MAQSGTVTLLFTDLVNSTEHLQRVGDETGQRVFRAHHHLMTDAINGGGGEELQWLGDGVLAAFSSAADAVRCAIKIQQTARRPIEGARLEVRIGIHVGEVLRRDNGYFGTPVVVARRLCDRASAGQIMCSRLIADLLAAREGFNFRDLGTLELKGIGPAMRVSEVVFERDDPAALINQTPFIGRDEDLKRLTAKLEDVCNGRGAVVMLMGEAGIGKTRTLDEFADLARQRGAMVLRGTCTDGDWQRPYGPFAEAIVDYMRSASPAELKEVLGKSAPTVARIVPALHEKIAGLLEPPPLDKEEERFRLLDAVAQTLIAIAARAPLVLMLDDLHWADRGTVAMLNHVSHFVAANSILLLGAYREADLERKHPLLDAIAAIRRQPNFERIALKGLDQSNIEELLEMIAEDAPAALVKAISEETSGNPFFIRELLLHLMDEGKILRDGQGWTAHLSIEELGVPEGVRDLVAQRLSKISEEARRLLSIAAAFNGSFSFDVAAAVAGLDEASALTAADEALDARLLRPGPDSSTLDFSHAIIRHTLYSGLNPARRVRMHRQIAEEMERVWGERASEHAAEVAYQFWRGATASGAVRGADYAIAAANNAEAAYDHDDVAAFLRIALELLGPEDPRRLNILSRRALALTWTANEEEALKLAREAGAIIATRDGPCAAAGHYDQIARTMLYASVTRGAWQMAAEGLGFTANRRDITWASLREIDISRSEAEDPDNPGIRIDSPDNRELYEVLKSLPVEHLLSRNFDVPFDSRADILQDPTASATTLLMLAGDYRRGLILHQREAVENEQHGAIARATRGWADVARCHNALGDFTEGRAALDRALKLSARMTRPTSGLLSLVAARGELFYALDEGWEELLADAAASTFVRDPGPESKWASAMINSYVSYLFAQINQPDLAMQRVNLLPAALELGASWARTYCPTACIAAATLWMLNRKDHVDVIERNLRVKVLAPDFRSPMSDCRLSLARLCALQERYDEACEWFGKAREVLDEQGARPLRAIADFDQSLMYLRRGKPEDRANSQPYLDAATRQFTQLGMKGWLRNAERSAALVQ